jgi:hypothetical protein
MAEMLQLLGALLVLVPFALLQIGYWKADSAGYLLSNLAGSSLLATLALLDSQWGFLLLEAAWAVVAAWATGNLIRSRPRAAGGGGAAGP